MTFKVGDRVDYKPTMIPEDSFMENCLIDMIEPRGYVFIVDMISVKEIGHWIPASDCVLHV